MNHKRVRALVFDAFLMVLMIVLLITALKYNHKARFVPLIIIIPTLALTASQVLFNVVKMIKSLRLTVNEDGSKSESVWRKELIAVFWVVLIIGMVYLIGFVYAIPLYIFLALRVRGKESWKLSILLSLGAWAFLYVLFVVILKISFDNGLLLDLALG